MTANAEIMTEDADIFEHVSEPAERVVNQAGQSLAVRQEQNNLPAAVTPMTMIDRALASNAAPETLEKLLALQERWEASQARKAFDEAMAAAKAEIPTITKNRRVGYEHKNGSGETSYRHEDLGEIARVVTPILARHGLSYRFRTSSDINQPVSVTCIVSHRAGHSEENTLLAGADNSGKKNSIQAIGSTITYLQRYTLKAALGLAAASDDDGARADEQDTDKINPAQLKRLQSLLELTQSDIVKFCELGRIDSLADLPKREFDNAIRLLEQKKAKMQAEGKLPKEAA